MNESENRPVTDKRKAPKTAFKPGQSGNPGGRPKKLDWLSERCQDMSEEVLNKLAQIVAVGEPKDQVAAAKIILAYGFGSPHQSVQVDANVTTQERLVEGATDEALREAAIKQLNGT